MLVMIDYVLAEFKAPFQDPRTPRTSLSIAAAATQPPSNQGISNSQLFYMLIDETERTFRQGMIVTASVTRVLDARDSQKAGFFLCRLDNGLEARVDSGDIILGQGLNSRDVVGPGHLLEGRIHEIRDKDESKFSVTLNCKRQDLERHHNYIPEELIKLGI